MKQYIKNIMCNKRDGKNVFITWQQKKNNYIKKKRAQLDF